MRYRVQAELAGRLFEAFPVDVAFSDPVRWLPDHLTGTELLAFAGIERVDVPGLAIEQHVAEKVHAYTRSFGKDERPSSRPKDLVDIVLVKRSTTLDGRALQAALEATFTARAQQSLPTAVPPPPSAWSNPYAKLAETVVGDRVSQREIAVRLGINRRTVRRLAEADELVDNPEWADRIDFRSQLRALTQTGSSRACGTNATGVPLPDAPITLSSSVFGPHRRRIRGVLIGRWTIED